MTCNGQRDILGLWAGAGGEGAKHWLHVLTELKNRGVHDVPMVVCDGLTGLPDAIAAVWPDNPAGHMRRPPASRSQPTTEALIDWEKSTVSDRSAHHRHSRPGTSCTAQVVTRSRRSRRKCAAHARRAG